MDRHLVHVSTRTEYAGSVHRAMRAAHPQHSAYHGEILLFHDRIAASVLPQGLSKDLPLLRTKAKAREKLGFCLSVGMRCTEKIVRDLFSIHLEAIGVRKSHAMHSWLMVTNRKNPCISENGDRLLCAGNCVNLPSAPGLRTNFGEERGFAATKGDGSVSDSSPSHFSFLLQESLKGVAGPASRMAEARGARRDE